MIQALRAINLEQVNIMRSIVLPVVVATIALATSVIGAIIIGSGGGIDGVNGFVESLSGSSSSKLGGWGLAAPLGFAFAVGAASAVNPCGFAMLPAYLGLYLGDTENVSERAHPLSRLRKALVVGGTVTAGFVVLFGSAGLVIGLGARAFIVDVLPWLGLVIGVVLALLGSWMLGGGKLYTGIAARAASNMGNPGQISLKGLLHLRHQLRHRIVELYLAHILGGGRDQPGSFQHRHLPGPVLSLRFGDGCGYHSINRWDGLL